MKKILPLFLRDKFGDRKGVVFDFGCGPGHDVEGLKDLGWEEIGIDLPENDLNEPYISTKKADFICSFSVLQFIKDRKMFAKNISNNLKDGGYFLVQTFSKSDDVFGEKRGMTKEELLDIFKDFHSIETWEERVFDDHPGHNHWHQLIFISGQK